MNPLACRMLCYSLAAAGLPTVLPAAESVSLTVTLAAQEMGSPLGLSTGTDLPIGNLIRFGYFTNPALWVEENADNLSLLDTHFVELASTHVGYFGGATVRDDSGAVTSHEDGTLYEQAVGLFAHGLTFNPEALGLLSTRCFLWGFDADSIGAASEHVLLSDDTWTLTGFGSVVYDVQTVDPLSADDVFLAVRGPEASSLGMGPLNKLRPIAPVPIPEPHLALLASLGLALTSMWRRPVRR